MMMLALSCVAHTTLPNRSYNHNHTATQTQGHKITRLNASYLQHEMGVEFIEEIHDDVSAELRGADNYVML